MAFNAARGLRGKRRKHIGCIPSFITVLACPLLVPPEVHFVAPRHLPGDPHARVLPGAVVEGLVTVVRVIDPLGQIAGVLITPQSYVLTVALVARSPVKPHPVFQNRAAKRPIQIPEFL